MSCGISIISIINSKGDVIIFRQYRDEVDRNMSDAFRVQVVARKEAANQAPVVLVDGTTYAYTRHGELYFVAATRHNSNPSLLFQFLFQLKDIFASYFGPKFDEDKLRNNFTLVYELLDEVCDYGIPQNCAIDVLRMYINLGSVQAQERANSQLTEMITGKTDWRKTDLKYRKNEVFIDVLESVNLLLSSDGTLLRSDVTGTIMMKTFLSGMPECKFGLNDKLLLDNEAAAGRHRPGVHGVEIDDVTFHRCVRLGKFDADRTITFIPPDGEFELMRYRVTENINLPFRVLPVVEEKGKTRVLYNLKAASNFSPKLYASNVVFKIPCPPTTARANVTVSVGRAKYEPAQGAILWRIRRFPGGQEFSFNGEAELMASTREQSWSRPPIEVSFHVPMFTASGLHVRFLKVLEKSGYKVR